MTHHKNWLRAVTRMQTRLTAEYRYQQRWADPWVKKALSMVSAWRNRASRKRRGKQAKPGTCRVDLTWQRAVPRMLTDLRSREAGRAERGTWKYWARLRTQQVNRYVPKSAMSKNSDHVT